MAVIDSNQLDKLFKAGEAQGLDRAKILQGLQSRGHTFNAEPTWQSNSPAGAVGSSTGYRSYLGDVDRSILGLEDRAAKMSALRDQQDLQLDSRLQDSLGQIDSSYQSREADKRSQQSRDVQETSVGLARIGGYLGGSAGEMGVFRNLEQTHRKEIDNLHTEKQGLIQEARQLYEDKKFALAESRVKEAQTLEQEIYNREKDFRAEERLAQQDQRAVAEEERKTYDFKIKKATNSAWSILDQLTDDEEKNGELIYNEATKLGIDPEEYRGIVEQADLARQKSKNDSYASGIAGEYQFAKQNGYTGTFEEYKQFDEELKRTPTKMQLDQDADGNPILFNPDTGEITYPGGQIPSGADGPVAIMNGLANVGVGLTKDKRQALNRNVQRLVDAGDIDGAREAIVAAAIGGLPADEQKAAIGRNKLIKSLDTLEADIAAFEAAGGKLGIFTGLSEKALQKIGSTQSGELAKLANRIGLSIIEYRKSVSGAAFTESEKADYNAVFPSIGNNKALNQAKIDSLREMAVMAQDTTLSTVMGPSAYRELMEEGAETKSETLDEYYRANPDKQAKIDRMVQDGLSPAQIRGAFGLSYVPSSRRGAMGGGNFNVPASNLVAVVAKKYPEGYKGGQCGDFAHKLVDFSPVGDSKKEKINSVKKNGILASIWRKNPQVGDVIITGENPTYGHVAVINKIFPDGRIQLSESNYRQSERVSHDRIININNPQIYGAIRGSLKPSFTKQNAYA